MVSLAILPATWAGQFGNYEPKGFLSDYNMLQSEGGKSISFIYRDPQVDTSKYPKLLIDRIKIYLKTDAESKEIDPEAMKALADYFHAAIVKAVESAYTVVREPGPDVLRLRVAITDLVPNQPEASVITLVVPYAWVGESVLGAAKGHLGRSPFLGEATVEMEALDSMSHKQLGAYIETRIGKKYDIDLESGIGQAVERGVDSYMKAYETWAYTRQSMDHWAQLIRERLDADRSADPGTLPGDATDSVR
jgi:hypothetical protein